LDFAADFGGVVVVRVVEWLVVEAVVVVVVAGIVPTGLLVHGATPGMGGACRPA
jgi:hypothetical protein